MEKNHRLFLRNLPASVTKNDIDERFRDHGTITNIEIKEKANALGSDNKFAFVNITTTERNLNTCFQELKNLVINGTKVHMEIAKESFLARLQREREESKAVTPIPKPEEPKADIKPIRIAQSVKPAVVPKSTKKIFEIDFEVTPKPQIKEKLKPVIVEPKSIAPVLSTAEQKKKNESDEKRLKSLMERKMAFKMKEGMIREALNSVDQKPLGKKIIFPDNLDSFDNDMGENKGQKQGQKRLFDDDDGDDDVNLENNEFKIRPNMNKKLQNLQSNYANDKRFTLDDRFVEDEDNDGTNYVEPASGIHEERDWQLDILQNVLGRPMKASGNEENNEKRRKGMIRYDPMKNDYPEYEIPVKTNNPKKANKVKRQLSNENDIEKDKPPELSKDTFYNVSENLANTLKQDEQFSLLKTFGTETPSIGNPVEGKVRAKEGHQFNFNMNDPFKYDSSDNEGHNEEEIIKDAKKIESKNDWNDSLFFQTNDIRFEDARKFFNKQSAAGNTEFSNLRRELKQIVRSKIQNNLRKKITWKKKKVQHNKK